MRSEFFTDIPANELEEQKKVIKNKMDLNKPFAIFHKHQDGQAYFDIFIFYPIIDAVSKETHAWIVVYNEENKLMFDMYSTSSKIMV